jgi:hypothetical protein
MEFYISSKIRTKTGLRIRLIISGVILTLLGIVWYLEENDFPFFELD